MVCNLVTEYYNKEKEKFAFARNEFEKARFHYHIEEMHYNNIVLNYNWRDWVYIDYTTYLREHFKSEHSKIININKYSDEKVFARMKNLSDEEYNIFSIDKEVADKINPKTLDDVAIIFALGKTNNSYGNILYEEIFNQDKSFLPPKLSEILSKTNNTILYDNQIIEVLCQLLGDMTQARRVNMLIRRIRYCDSVLKILRDSLKSDQTAEKFISKFRPTELRQTIKIAYISIKSSCDELGYTEDTTDKIFFMLIRASILSCKKSTAKSRAVHFYKYCSSIK